MFDTDRLKVPSKIKSSTYRKILQVVFYCFCVILAGVFCLKIFLFVCISFHVVNLT